jgi:hypothetical protein
MIENLRKYREDGQIIHDGHSIERTKSLGPISRVTRVRWRNEGKDVERSSRFGMLTAAENA